MNKQWIRVILAASKLGFMNLVMEEDWDRVKKLDRPICPDRRRQSGATSQSGGLTEKVTDRLIHFLKDKHLQVMVIPANE